MEMKSAFPIQQHLLLFLGLVVVTLICARVDAAELHSSSTSSSSSSSLETELAVVSEKQNSARKHKHHLLLFLGGLKSVAAVILIKIKIVLVVAAIVAVSMFTVKYLMGATTLPYLHNKANFAQLPAPPPSPQYLPVVHEPVYGHEYSSSVPWEHSSHEIYHGNEWSKVGNGARSLLDFTNNLDLEKISSTNVFNLKKKKIRRRRR